MKSEFNNLLAKRRSIYALGDNVKESLENIYTLIKDTVRNSPTAFNSQTVRTVVLFGKASNKVWDIVEDRLKSEVPNEEAFAKTKEKIATFRAGFGTILFLTDTAIVEKLERDFPLYAANFADWAEQGIGGAQQAVWAALAEQHIGASLQHYNPLIDDAIHEAFDLPKEWKLRAQMPFGSIEAPAGEKDYLDFFVEFPDFMSRLHACEAGHDNVEDEDVVICFFKPIQKIHSIGICMNRYRCAPDTFVFMQIFFDFLKQFPAVVTYGNLKHMYPSLYNFSIAQTVSKVSNISSLKIDISGKRELFAEA